jgi:hypothetical protein
MIGTIRKHSKWLWVVIATVTIISFVYWGSNSSNSSHDRAGGGNYGSIDGQRVTREEKELAVREVYLRHFVQTGQWPDKTPQQSGFDEDRETYYRLFFLRKLKEYNIHIDAASVAQAANDILQGFGRGKALPLDTFVQQALMPRANVQDFQRFLQHELAIQQLVSVLGLSGKLVSPEEAQAMYERNYREVATEAVYFSASNYLAGVAAPSPETLAGFYRTNQAYYRIPDRVQVSYVEFGITNHLAEVVKTITNLAEVVDANFREMGTNYLRFGKTAEEAKVKIRELVLHQAATKIASQQADKFASDLLDKEPLQAANLAALAKTNGLAVKVSLPFEEQNGPAEFDGGPDFGKTAFLLTAAEPIASQPLIGENAIYVIALDKQIPSEIPPLDRIHDRVLADYKYIQAKNQAQLASLDFVKSTTNALAGGKTFAGVCADAKVKPVSLPPFSLGRGDLSQLENHVELDRFKQAAFATPAGRISHALESRDGAVVVYVRQLLPLDQAKMKTELPSFISYLRRMRQSEAINEWFSKEAQKALRDTPLGQPKPAPPLGTAKS